MSSRIYILCENEHDVVILDQDYRGEVKLGLTGFVWTVATAEALLYIPGLDEQPVSVDVVGVGPDGRMTWQIVPGKPTGTISSFLPVSSPYRGRRSFPPKTTTPNHGWGSVCELQKIHQINNG